MIRKLLGRVAVVTIVLGVSAAAPMAVAEATPTAHSASNANSCVLQGFLDDGAGTGSAASLQPGVTAGPGLEFYQETTGAWQLCWDFVGRLTLFANQEQWCMADDNGNAILRGCNSNTDQQWNVSSCGMSGCLVKNINGGVLCAGGSVGAEDFVKAQTDCSDYHQHWVFSTTS